MKNKKVVSAEDDWMRTHNHQSDEKCFDGSCGPKEESYCKPQHTPTPWKKLGRDIAIDLTYDKSVTASFAEIATTNIGHWTVAEADANAAYIIKAVNCHEELLALLKRMLNGHHPTRNEAEPLIAKAEGK